MNVLIAMVIIPLATICIALYVGIIETVIQVLDEKAEKRRAERQHKAKLRVWKQLAIEETDPIEKGYKVARLLNYAYENNRKEVTE